MDQSGFRSFERATCCASRDGSGDSLPTVDSASHCVRIHRPSTLPSAASSLSRTRSLLFPSHAQPAMKPRLRVVLRDCDGRKPSFNSLKRSAPCPREGAPVPKHQRFAFLPLMVPRNPAPSSTRMFAAAGLEQSSSSTTRLTVVDVAATVQRAAGGGPWHRPGRVTFSVFLDDRVQVPGRGYACTAFRIEPAP